MHRYETDRYGDRHEVSTHIIQNTLFAPRPNAMGRGSNEFTDRRDTVIADAELYVPYGADVKSTDVIELESGAQWEVAGSPEPWQGITGWRSGTVVPMRRMTG